MTHMPATPPGDPDDALVLAYGAGDPAAAAVLTRRLAPRLLSYTTRFLGDREEAEDVVQETLLRLWRRAPDWQPGRGRVANWCYRVAGNLCTSRMRRRGRKAPIETADEPVDVGPSATERLTNVARAEALQEALSRLPERQRQAVILRHLEGLSNPEIAAVMDIGVVAVESLTARGKRALQADLGLRRAELGYEDDRS